MPKHTFKFPHDVVDAIKRHVGNAVAAVEPARYRQEANYTAALVSRLDGTAYEGEYGYGLHLDERNTQLSGKSESRVMAHSTFSVLR